MIYYELNKEWLGILLFQNKNISIFSDISVDKKSERNCIVVKSHEFGNFYSMRVA